MAVYLLLLKFVIRVDVSKLKAVNPEQIEVQMLLPPMNFQQKAYLYMIPCNQSHGKHQQYKQPFRSAAQYRLQNLHQKINYTSSWVS